MNKIGVVGLGYVGLPLAVEFGKTMPVIGLDISADRINLLSQGIDATKEVEKEELLEAKNLKFTSKLEDLKSCDVFIVTVPTPIDKFKTPDLTPLLSASKALGSILKKGDIVIYESTVYPGCTEEDCVPVLENESGLQYNEDFFCGYSPERINPGDKTHRLPNIKKVTSGSNSEIAEKVDQLYKKIITAGTYKASSIKVAEAAKVIENSQRDLNIAFVNELSLIFEKIGIDTLEVLEAAGTKWNFLPFRPGLVGGHCIGVDPYYLTHKAQSFGYNPEVILSGRRINDNMGVYIANRLIKLIAQQGNPIKGCKILMLGITFKENCPDIRNSRVIDVYNELLGFGVEIDVYDPHADFEEVKNEYGIALVSNPRTNYAGVLLAVAHEEFIGMDLDVLTTENGAVYDVKGVLPKDKISARL